MKPSLLVGVDTLPQPSIPVNFGLGRVALSTRDMDCLEIALYFLSEQLNRDLRHPLFEDLRGYHINHIRYWLDNTHLWRLFENHEYVVWTVKSLEDVEWLRLAILFGVVPETITKMSIEAAEHAKDIETSYPDSDLVKEELAYQRAYEAHSKHYHAVAQNANRLLFQLENRDKR